MQITRRLLSRRHGAVLASVLAFATVACAAEPEPTPAPVDDFPPIPTNGANITAEGSDEDTRILLENGCSHAADQEQCAMLSEVLLEIAQASRGFDSFVALKTARGWYLEQRDAMPPMHSHHEPRSLYYEVERTRIADGGAKVRMVDSSQVFYPGQGNAGTSHTSWYERTCRVFGDRVACSKPVSIATRHCKRDSAGNGETNETCTGDTPPS